MKYLGWVLAIGLVIVSIGFTVFLFETHRTIELNGLVNVSIEENSGTEGAVMALHSAGVIQSRWALLLQLLFTGERSNIKSGEYQFSGSVTMQDVIDIITQAKIVQPEVQITLLEGWTNEDMATYLSEAGVVDFDGFVETADTHHSQQILPNNEYPYLVDKPLSVGLQGYLFPDTYRVFEGETEVGIIEKMLDTFDAKFTQSMRDDLAINNRTIFDAVTLASIVEREVLTPEDKAIVAGIFWKRIDNSVRLQSDATINYVTNKGDTTPSGSDLNVESAYNTYRNDGLPPTPICNPGLDSLEAVVYPEETEYWFFLTTPDGEVVYSVTYEDHLANRALYYE